LKVTNNKNLIGGDWSIMICKHEGCDNEKITAKGLCRKHYELSKNKRCTLIGCKEVFYAKGMCKSHYYQVKNIIEEKTCGVDGCNNKSHSRKLCHKHYLEIKNGLCSFNGCTNKSHAKGLCMRHYQNKYRYNSIT
jgi:hypothetical protein